MRDVAGAAIGVVGGDRELLARAELHRAVRRGRAMIFSSLGASPGVRGQPAAIHFSSVR